VALEDPSMLARAQAETTPLEELIRWYIDQYHTIVQWRRSKQSALEFLERHEIGREDVYRFSVSRLVQHVCSRRAERAGPTTAQTDLIYLGVVLEFARALGLFPVDPNVAAEARKACRRLRLIGESNRRDVRPSEAQLLALTDYLLHDRSRVVIPMADIMWFAIYSARRESEVCQEGWQIALRQPRTGALMFPYQPQSIKRVSTHAKERLL
jgi:hypothetical protein